MLHYSINLPAQVLGGGYHPAECLRLIQILMTKSFQHLTFHNIVELDDVAHHSGAGVDGPGLLALEAARAAAVAQDYVNQREGFGIKLADRESVQIKLGELGHQIQIGRLLTMHAAWKLDHGDRARKEVSMAKVHVADTLHNAADVAIQLNGGIYGAYYERGQAHFALKDFKAAIKDFKRCLELDPTRDKKVQALIEEAQKHADTRRI